MTSEFARKPYAFQSIDGVRLGSTPAKQDLAAGEQGKLARIMHRSPCTRVSVLLISKMYVILVMEATCGMPPVTLTAHDKFSRRVATHATFTSQARTAVRTCAPPTLCHLTSTLAIGQNSSAGQACCILILLPTLSKSCVLRARLLPWPRAGQKCPAGHWGKPDLSVYLPTAQPIGYIGGMGACTHPIRSTDVELLGWMIRHWKRDGGHVPD